MHIPHGKRRNLVWHSKFRQKIPLSWLCKATGSETDCRSRGREFKPQPSRITFMEINHEVISTAILPSPLDSRRAVVSYRQKYVHYVLVNCLWGLSLSGNSVSRLTDRLGVTKPTKWLCPRQRLRSAWSSAQSDQSLCCPHEESLGPSLPIEHTAKTLIRLGISPVWFEYSLGA